LTSQKDDGTATGENSQCSLAKLTGFPLVINSSFFSLSAPHNADNKENALLSK